MARTVLLADDSVTAQNMGRRILTDAGYEVITVNNGSAALKKIHESRPDLIVLDVYMPGYGGLEVCQRLKETEATQKIPVLLTVGKMEPFKAEEAKRVHADGHIIKPFDASELLAALAKLEDRIVPEAKNRSESSAKSDNARADKKSPEYRGGDPAVSYDDSQTSQISYLAEVKNRFTPSAAEEIIEERHPSKTGDSEQQSPMTTEEADSVTFAAGPIPQQGPPLSAPQQFVPEFEVERSAENNDRSESASSSEVAELQPLSASATRAITLSADSFPSVDTSAQTSSALVPEAAQQEPAMPQESASHWIAENIALTAEEASCSLEQEMQQAQSFHENVSDANTSQEMVAEPAISPEAETQSQPEPREGPGNESGAAFAAAASASAGSSTDAVSSTSTESEPIPGSESAAAWENWQGIRDTVVTREMTEAVADSVAEVSQAEVPPQEASFPGTASPELSMQSGPRPAAEAPSSEAAPAAPASSDKPATEDPLSNIVDNVLAELKPRLLAEIAKQIAAGKK